MALEEANRALEASERELTLIIETIPGFVWCASTDGQLTYVNKRLSEYIGKPVDSLLGMAQQAAERIVRDGKGAGEVISI